MKRLQVSPQPPRRIRQVLRPSRLNLLQKDEVQHLHHGKEPDPAPPPPIPNTADLAPAVYFPPMADPQDYNRFPFKVEDDSPIAHPESIGAEFGLG